ncbi:MAG: DUF2461 family protein, partial [Burkholderiaceae bacterium]
PAREFTAALEARLAKQTGVAVTGKIYRINRDLRFARDAAPYNTHIHIGFSDPATGASWMVGLELDQVIVGYGAFAFDDARLAAWRGAVAQAAGDKLARLLVKLTGAGHRLDAPELKRVPSPWPQDHPRAALLRRKSLALWTDGLALDTIYGEAGPARIAQALAAFRPLRAWWIDNL